jgi:ketosteroid isomerase-like protein
LRAGDSIISGKDGIFNYYQMHKNNNATVEWTPDFIDVSDDGTLAYTYGKYCWKIAQEDNTIKEYKGIFHTVWKRQSDGSWKYVWD